MAKEYTLSKNPDVLSLEWDWKVSAKGIFYTYLSEQDVKFLQDRGATGGKEKYVRRKSKPGYFEAPTLSELKKKIQDDMDIAVSEELINTTFEIDYMISTMLSYTKTEDGTIVPNCSWTEDGPLIKDERYDNYVWLGGTEESHAGKRGPLTIRFYCAVMRCETYKYGNGKTKQKRSRIHHNDCKELDYSGRYLANIVAMDDKGGPWDRKIGETKTMPYTEKAAKFFVMFHRAMCKMGEMMTLLAQDDTVIPAMIDRGAAFTLTQNAESLTNKPEQ